MKASVFKGELRTGDLLHVPRGFPHAAETMGDEPSLHLTVSMVKNAEWSDVLLATLEEIDVNSITPEVRFELLLLICHSFIYRNSTMVTRVVVYYSLFYPKLWFVCEKPPNNT